MQVNYVLCLFAKDVLLCSRPTRDPQMTWETADPAFPWLGGVRGVVCGAQTDQIDVPVPQLSPRPAAGSEAQHSRLSSPSPSLLPQRQFGTVRAWQRDSAQIGTGEESSGNSE